MHPCRHLVDFLVPGREANQSSFGLDISLDRFECIRNQIFDPGKIGTQPVFGDLKYFLLGNIEQIIDLALLPIAHIDHFG